MMLPRFSALPWRIEFQRWADGTVHQTVEYMRDHGIAHESVTAFAGCIGLANVEFVGESSFTFPAIGGEPAAVCEVIDFDADNDPVTVDLVAWSWHDPHMFGTATGNGLALGRFNVGNPATYDGGKLLKVHRTPLAWLQSGCGGLCILDRDATGEALGKALGPLLAEDEEHARDLGDAFLGLPYKPRVAFPATSRKREAA